MARILIADDNPLDRRMLASDLEDLGHEILFAADGAEALTLLKREVVDLLLLDMHMGEPATGGAATFDQMQRSPQLRQIPVLILSGVQGPDVVDYIARGAEDYLRKSADPADRALLKARVTNCLQKKQLRDNQARNLQELNQERQNVNWLLSALFPFEIVSRLLPMLGEARKSARINIEPQRYAAAAVMFCDIVDFTAFSEVQDPRVVVSHLQELISRFERIAEECGLEKIKTIGDSFMATAGLRDFVANPVKAAVECGWKFQEAASCCPPQWKLRIGIDYGPVVAGIIGNKKFQYDIWGRTVNLAARVESEGVNDRVNLSEAAWNQVSNEYDAEITTAYLKGMGPGPQSIFVLIPPNRA